MQLSGDYKRRVLIVDDEEINREILSNILKEKYDVSMATNGREALRMIREDKDRYSLILLDIIMPEMDGYELLSILHDDSELKQIPVIVLTVEKSAEVRSIQLGAVDFIPKPYDMPEVILARVERSVELFESSFIIKATEKDELTGQFVCEEQGTDNLF